jgi:hypothetical protein
MSWRGRTKHPASNLPIATFLESSIVQPRSVKTFKPVFNRSNRTFQQAILFGIAVTMTVTGVVASVAITISGNSSNTPNVISLGVGKAQASSCNNSTAVKTDTISQWDDNAAGGNGDFTLQRVNVSGVQSSCQNNAMTLVINMTSGTDLNVTCNLPATGNAVYNQGTFVFTTSSYTAASGEYACPTFPTSLYMASISAAAVQIK